MIGATVYLTVAAAFLVVASLVAVFLVRGTREELLPQGEDPAAVHAA